ncbi:MAG: MBL fold metallo-hydrolase [Bacilli bacterium]|nr:MBL fold metallo-hydrolase [Bacilli bacterium]MDD4734208.1 MBL fold metallo-hydrolase [Bacilli bacterium]
MKVKIYNVEHGSCTHIITPNNLNLLFDIGSKGDKSMASHIKENYLKQPIIPSYNSNYKQIDYLCITHPHEDHIYDLPKLKELGIAPKVLWRDSSAFDVVPTDNTGIHKVIADTANDMSHTYTNPVSDTTNPTLSSNNGGVSFEIIQPPVSMRTKDDLNTFSPIIVMTYSKYKFIITGDNSKNILQYMMDNNYKEVKDKIKDADILIAPHHGRDTEFCKDFYDCVNPQLTVISDKKIEHDSQTYSSTNYSGRGMMINNEERYTLTTRKDGTITFDFDDYHFNVVCNPNEY